MPFDHAEFTRDVRELVAQVPEQREPKIEEGQRIWLPDFDGGTYLVIDEVSEPDADGVIRADVHVETPESPAQPSEDD